MGQRVRHAVGGYVTGQHHSGSVGTARPSDQVEGQFFGGAGIVQVTADDDDVEPAAQLVAPGPGLDQPMCALQRVEPTDRQQPWQAAALLGESRTDSIHGCARPVLLAPAGEGLIEDPGVDALGYHRDQVRPPAHIQAEQVVEVGAEVGSR